MDKPYMIFVAPEHLKQDCEVCNDCIEAEKQGKIICDKCHLEACVNELDADNWGE